MTSKKISRSGNVGRWVLKGLGKRRQSVRRPAKRIAKRTKRIRLFEVPEEPAAQLPVPVTHEPEAPIEPAKDESQGLLTTELIRPDARLKRCVEGFLLDQRSPHTQRAYGKDIKRFMKYLLVRRFDQGPEKVDRHIIVGYKDWLLSEGLEHTTVDRHLATLRSLFRWMVDESIIEKNPAESVRLMNPKRISRTNGFTDEEVRKILDQPNLHKKSGAQHHAILMVLFYCGLRRSELVELRTTNITTERGQRVLRLTGKGNVDRLIPLIKPVWASLEYYLFLTGKDLSSDQYLFTPTKNNRTKQKKRALDPSAIYYIVTQYAKKAGIQNRVSPHSCRATAISNARDHQVSDRAIQEFAGWSSTEMITRYDKRRTAVEDSAAHSISYFSDPNAYEETPTDPEDKPPHKPVRSEP